MSTLDDLKRIIEVEFPALVLKVDNGLRVLNARLSSTFTQLAKSITTLINDTTLEKNKVSQIAITDAATFEYMAEINRINGQSGVLNARAYEEYGTDSYHRPHDIGYSAVNMHDHPEYKGMCGLAESSYMVNGYYVRSRHNDYRWKKPSTTSTGYLQTEDVLPPAVPASVLSKTVIEEQMAQMRAEVLKGTDFKLNLAYVEVWFENISDSLTDPFESFRHQIDAATLAELFSQELYLNYTGHKNRLENIPFFMTPIRTIVDGQPIISVMKYRIMVAPIGKLSDYPLHEYLSIVPDYKTCKRANLTPNQLMNTRMARYRVNPVKNIQSGNYFNTRVTIDEWMEKIPGLNNYAGAPITDTYTQYGLQDTVLNHKLTTIKDAKFYHRWYTFANNDASNRRHAKRGFNDPTLFVALNTQEKVTPIQVGDEIKRVSYAFPLELLVDTPLASWNPFKLKKAARPQDILKSGADQANAYEGWHEQGFFYLTPLSFFSGGPVNPDPADTNAGTKWVMDETNVPRAVIASGVRTHLPRILGEPNIRLRYPIYPQYHEGSYQMAEVELLKAELNQQLQLKYPFPAKAEDPVQMSLVLLEADGHTHMIFLRKSEVDKLNTNQSVVKDSTTDAAHVHTVTISKLNPLTFVVSFNAGHTHGLQLQS